MDVSFNQFAGKLEIESPVSTSIPLDWPGLMARLAAAHATRLTLAAYHCATPSGSFAPDWAPNVAAFLATAGREPVHNSSGDVNQDAKVDSKPSDTIGMNSKGEDPTAVRGLS